MLERLDSIDWASLGTAYGSATPVPGLIRDLLSTNPDERESAISQLYMGICHQLYSAYEATAYAIPLLLELAGSDATPDRAPIVQLLGDIARAIGYLEGFESELVWVRLGRTEAWRGLATYLDLLRDTDLGVRIAAAYAISLLLAHSSPENLDSTTPHEPVAWTLRHLTDRLAEEPDDPGKGALAFALGYVAERYPRALDSLTELARESEGPATRLAAAMALAKAGSETSDEAVRILVEALPRSQPCDPVPRPLADLPWEGASLAGLINLVCKLGMGRADQTLPALLDVLKLCSSDLAERDAQPVLRLVFGGDKVPSGLTAASLTGPQRQVLRVLAENREFWRGSVSGSLVLRRMGLPDSRRSLRAFLGRDAEVALPSDEHAETALSILDRVIAESPAPQCGPPDVGGGPLHPAAVWRELGEARDRWRSRTIDDQARAAVLKLDLSSLATDAILAELARCPRLKELNLHDSDVTDAGLRHLASVPELERLNLSETAVTDAGLQHLTSLTELRSLALSSTAITDKGLAIVSRLGKLRGLYIGGTAITDAGLAHLSALSQLQSLNLSHTGVTDTAFTYLAGLTRLEELWLKDTKVTGTGASCLVGLTSLSKLYMSGPTVGDAGAEAVSVLTSLRKLSLQRTAITDAGLQHLARLESLEMLYLTGTLDVTSSGVAALRRAAPSLRGVHADRGSQG